MLRLAIKNFAVIVSQSKIAIQTFCLQELSANFLTFQADL
jgi:hypothetical protein